MKVKIGEIIRTLRHEKSCTQEQLAQAIGVSAQAISRWESMNGYPDIEYIPAIADYFGISIDKLFGYVDTETAEREKRIKEILKAANEMILDNERAEECVALLRNALSEFPSSDDLWLLLAGTLTTLGTKAIDTSRTKKNNFDYVEFDHEYFASNPYFNEARAIFERIISGKASSDIRDAALFSLLNLYPLMGCSDKLVKLAKSQPRIFASREILLAQYGEREERDRLQGEALLELADRFAAIANMAILTKKPFPEWEKCLQHTISTIEGLFPDGRYGKYHFSLRTLYFSGAIYSYKAGNSELALDFFAKGVEHTQKYTALIDTGEYRYTAPLISKVVHDTSGWVKLPKSAIYDWTAKCPPDFLTLIHTDPRFDGII